MNRTVSADEARKLLDETDGPPTVFSHLSHIDGSAAISVITSVATAKIDKARISSVNELREALASVLERESATDAWLAEIGHLSLAAAGVELAHLREREREMQYAYDCCASFAEWANAPTNRRAHNMEHMPPVTADDAFSVVFPILQKERADLAAFANRVGAVISGRSYADAEENLRVDELPAVATQVAALGERAARAEKERDRLRDILLSAVTAAKNATLPPGFIWGNDAMEQFNFGKERAAEAVAGAIEAADLAAKEKDNG